MPTTVSTAPRTRADACPGALRLHEAADGWLARVRVPGGRLTGAQLAALARLAGDGVVHLTSRGNVQLRGLQADDGLRLASSLEAARLLPSPAHERARNLLCSPLTGLDDVGLVDARPVLAALDAALCSDLSLAELPGRFLLGVDDGRGDVLGLDLDAGVQASRVGWVLWRAGVLVGPVPDPVAALLDVARAFLRARSSEGTWRVAELVDSSALPIVPGHVGPVRIGGWQTAVVAVAPLQQLLPHQVELLARADSLVLTPWHAVVVEGGDLCALRTVGLVTDPSHAWTRTTACAGSACVKSLRDVRGELRLSDDPSRVHWSGCDRRCGKPRGEVVDVVATPAGWVRS